MAPESLRQPGWPCRSDRCCCPVRREAGYYLKAQRCLVLSENLQQLGFNSIKTLILSRVSVCFYLQPPVDAVDVVVMETGQHPHLLPVIVVTETYLTPKDRRDGLNALRERGGSDWTGLWTHWLFPAFVAERKVLVGNLWISLRVIFFDTTAPCCSSNSRRA